MLGNRGRSVHSQIHAATCHRQKPRAGHACGHTTVNDTELSATCQIPINQQINGTRSNLSLFRERAYMTGSSSLVRKNTFKRTITVPNAECESSDNVAMNGGMNDGTNKK